jgi:hypothetical protein
LTDPSIAGRQSLHLAEVAELADAADSKSVASNGVSVQPRPSAPAKRSAIATFQAGRVQRDGFGGMLPSMPELQRREMRWLDGSVEIDFELGREIATAKMARADGEPAFPKGTSLPLQTALQEWCDSNEPIVDNWRKRLQAASA